jgi:hypothetical protein
MGLEVHGLVAGDERPLAGASSRTCLLLLYVSLIRDYLDHLGDGAADCGLPYRSTSRSVSERNAHASSCSRLKDTPFSSMWFSKRSEMIRPRTPQL